MSSKCPHCHKSIAAKVAVEAPSQRSLDPFLSIKQVVALTGMSEATIRRRIADGTFPPGRLTSQRLRKWLQSVVEAWAASRAVDHCAEIPPPD